MTHPDSLQLLAQAHVLLLQRLVRCHGDDPVAGGRANRRCLARHLPGDVLDDGLWRRRRGLADEGRLLTHWCWHWSRGWLVHDPVASPVCYSAVHRVLITCTVIILPLCSICRCLTESYTTATTGSPSSEQSLELGLVVLKTQPNNLYSKQ